MIKSGFPLQRQLNVLHFNTARKGVPWRLLAPFIVQATRRSLATGETSLLPWLILVVMLIGLKGKYPGECRARLWVLVSKAFPEITAETLIH